MRWLVVSLALLAACQDTDGDGTRDGRDCGGADPTRNPGATEVCNGIDDDCDGFVDEGVAIVAYLDRDGDGFGDPESSRRVCAVPEDGSLNGDDCEDDDPTVSPDGIESCDGRDDDCDGSVDEGVQATWYADSDADGHGAGDPVVAGCIAPEGFVASQDDCDDADKRAWTAAPEVCDDDDNDCDGATDEDLPQLRVYVDADGDGAGDPDAPVIACGPLDGLASAATDCDDGDAARAPGAVDAPNGVDDDCDGYVDEIAVQTFADLEDALAVADTGAVVQLAAGTFAGMLTVDRADVTVAGEGCGNTVLYGDRSGSVVTLGGGALADLSVVGGEADRGGGVLVTADAELTRVCAAYNRADDGGGIAVVAGDATLEDVEVERNTAHAHGGGLYVGPDAAVHILRGRLDDNHATIDGGGAFAEGRFTARSTEVLRNSVIDDGGGLYLTGTGPARLLENVTLADNSGPSDGPALYATVAVSIEDVVVAGHTSDHGAIHAPLATWGRTLFWANGGADTDRGWRVEAVRADPRFLSSEDVRPAPRSGMLALDGTVLGSSGGPGAADGARWATSDDSDGDGLPDGWEVYAGTGPYVADAGADPDGDGLTNAQELASDTRPAVADTDDDGVPDGLEAASGSDPTSPADHAPMPVIKASVFAARNEPFDLDGSLSYDPDDDVLTVAWSVVSAPIDASARPTAPDELDTTLVPDRSGDWVLALDLSAGGVTRRVEHAFTVVAPVIVPDDATTVAEAVAIAGHGGSVALRPGTYPANVDLGSKDVTVFGLGRNADDVVIDARLNGRAFTAIAGESLTLAHLTVTGGEAASGGAVRLDDGDLVLTDVTLRGNHATGDGGGVLAARSHVDLTDVRFVANTAGARGGGLRLDYCDYRLVRPVFVGDSAGIRGGAMDVTGASGLQQATRSAMFSENRAPTGSAIFREGYGTAWIEHAGFTSNAGAGAVVQIQSGDTHVLGAVATANEGSVLFGRPITFAPTVAMLYNAVQHAPLLTSDASFTTIASGGAPGIPWVTPDGDPEDDVWQAPPATAAIDSARPEERDPDGSASDAGPFGGPWAPRGYGRWSLDHEGDGLADGWEARVGLDPSLDDHTTDADVDGLDALAEQAAGTDPFAADSDGDGVGDAVEIAAGQSPTDPRGHAPDADAGSDVVARIGTLATLDGSRTSDPDGDVIATLTWHFVSTPPGSVVSDSDLSPPNGVHPTFVPDVRGRYVLELNATDGFGTGTDTVAVFGWDELRVPDDYATLADAIEASVEHDEIVLSAGIHDGAADLVGRTLVVRGAGAGLTTVLGPRDRPPFAVSGGSNFRLVDLTVRRGLGDHGGLVDCLASTFSARGVVFSGGVAYQGGALALDACPTDLVDVDVVDNHTVGIGGGVWIADAPLTWTRGRLEANGGSTGGGLYLDDGSTGSLRNLVVAENAAGSGAGVYTDDAPIDAANLTFVRNRGSTASGALAVARGSATLWNVLFAYQPAGYGFWRATGTPVTGGHLAYWKNHRTTNNPTGTDYYADADLIAGERLGPWSLLVDQGASAFIDPDGSPADIGAFGGPDAASGFDVGYADSDADGLPDSWELPHGLAIGPDDSGSDTDGDGLPAAAEFAAHTLPDDADSDQDGVDDDVEVLAGDDPSDPYDHAPHAVPGLDRVGTIGVPVAFDATGSFDPDGLPLTYTWRFIDLPGTSLLTDQDLVGAAAMSFTPDHGGMYVVELAADDGAAIGLGRVTVVVPGDVSVPDDYLDLESALAAVAEGSQVLVDAGTWPCNVDLAARGATIVGAGPGLTVLDAGDAGAAFTLDTTAPVALSGLSIVGGFAAEGGAVSTRGGLLTLEDVEMLGNVAVSGGAVFVDAGDVLATDITIGDGYAVQQGAGFRLRDGALDVLRGTFANLTAASTGGAIYAATSTVELRNSWLIDNRASFGAGVYVDRQGVIGQVTLDHVTAVGQIAQNGAGVAYSARGADLDVRSSVIQNARPNAIGRASTTSPDPSALVRVSYTVAYDAGSAPIPTGSTVIGNVAADPKFVGRSDDGDPWNDDLGLMTSSPAVDAGDPTEQDRDATRADAGATGGPDAP